MENTVLHRLADYVMSTSPMLALRKSRARQRFDSAAAEHMFYGVYSCFDAALDKALPF